MSKIINVPFPYCAKVLPTIYSNTLSYYEEVCRLAKCCEEIVNKLTDWSSTIAELQEAIVDIDDMKRQIATLDSELVSLTGTVNDNYRELVGLVSELDKLVKDSVKDMNNRVDTVENSLSSLTQTIFNLNKKLDKEIAELRIELTELINSKYVDFEEKLTMLQLKVNQMKVNLQAQIDEINERLNEIDTTVINPWHWELGKISQQKNVDLMYQDLADCVPTASEYCQESLTAQMYSDIGLTALEYAQRGKEKLHIYWVFSPAFGWRQEINNVLTSILDFVYDVYTATAYSELDLTADEYAELSYSADDYYLANYQGGGGGGDTRGCIKFDPSNTGLTRREYEHLGVSQT